MWPFAACIRFADRRLTPSAAATAVSSAVTAPLMLATNAGTWAASSARSNANRLERRQMLRLLRGPEVALRSARP